MRIKIDKFYQNTKGQQVEAGEYNASDLPNGLAQYLVDNDHAIVIKSEAVEANAADSVIEVADSNDESERASLSAEYEALAGRKPSSNIKLETLRARVNEMQSEG